MGIALLFSGQGAQRPGMGIDLMGDPLFNRTVAEASAATGLDLAKIMQGDHGELDQTRYVQPALVTVSLGLYRMLQRDLDLAVSGMVGLSLGEYGALIASGALDFASGMQLLAFRGQAMQAVADQTPSAMAALLKPDVAAVEAICDQIIAAGDLVAVANYNTAKQVVIGGTEAGVARAVEEIQAQKAAKRAIPLQVSGAFHTALFAPVQAQLAKRLAAVPVHEPRVPVVSNTTTAPFEAATLRDTLAQQVAHPTHFGAGLARLAAEAPVTRTLELGPGKTLISFAAATLPGVAASHISNQQEYEAFLAEVQNGN